MSRKMSPEEELEKQYREYKAQFEQWREANKGSEGSEGYIQYVKQFEQWERDVEARRKSVRAKSEQDRRQQALELQQKQQNDEEAAARYAQQQQSYMAMHQKAMLEEERIRQQRQNPQPIPVEDKAKRGPHIQAEPQPTLSSQNLQRTALWGPDGADYTPADPMFARWGARAAPPNYNVTYQPPPSEEPINPSWYLMKKMEDNGLFYSYNVNINGLPEISLDGVPEGVVSASLKPEMAEFRNDVSLPSSQGSLPVQQMPIGRPVALPSDFSVPPPSLL
ncbi:unnamed protein product [Bursaphelenchus okinawaensis]|uniref:Uncharacterized protein n=1 Tax=Bursaphelenchus okinawaensis TaxID=465554 RepID=A0A811L5U2_9BILA|nr:unnamed protein product [Bursaphelenchus okinawaensis]CAG9118353.1 unnamed protein product [Bursaphelenchus okinawaensis]